MYSFKLGLPADELSNLKDMGVLTGESVSKMVNQLIKLNANKELVSDKMEYIGLGLDEDAILIIDKLSKKYNLSRIETVRQLIKG